MIGSAVGLSDHQLVLFVESSPPGEGGVGSVMDVTRFKISVEERGGDPGRRRGPPCYRRRPPDRRWPTLPTAHEAGLWILCYNLWVETFALIAAERRRLAERLGDLEPADWDKPSLCAGWSVHVVAAHLNAPWSVSVPEVLFQVLRSGGLGKGFDRVARELAVKLDPAACVAGLRSHADSRFSPPGAGPEAPLSDVIVHGADMLQPLGKAVTVDPSALATSLQWLARGRAKGFVPRGRVVGLAFEATDIDLRCGAGPAVVRGPAVAICSVLTGRPAMLGHLSGQGADLLASRL